MRRQWLRRQWLRRQRLTRARELILAIAIGEHAPLTLREIARRCGSINFSAFSSDFSRLHSQPPSRLLRPRR